MPDTGLTCSVVRVCYSKVLTDQISENLWYEQNMFAKYYLRNLLNKKGGHHNMPSMETPSTSTSIIQEEKDNLFEIYRIHAHTLDSEGNYDFFLVQYACDGEGIVSCPFSVYELGEISWQMATNIPRDNEVLRQYIKSGSNKFKKYTELTFGAQSLRGIKRKPKFPLNFGKRLSEQCGQSMRFLNNHLDSLRTAMFDKKTQTFEK